MATRKKHGGRVAGTPNKATVDARWAITAFVNAHADKLEKWLDEIYSEHGAKEAYSKFMETVEFAVPKLARTEVANPEGETFKTEQAIPQSDREILERWRESQK